jgi:hypothetical protein
VIYFIEAGDSGDIKIGYSGTHGGVEERRKSHQTGNPKPLNVLKVIEGTRRGETTIHKALSGCRLEGEWFERGPALALMRALTGEDVGATAGDSEPKTVRAESTLNNFTWEGPLWLYWEVEGDPITDEYTPRDVSARELWRMWKGRYGLEGTAQISWFIHGPGFAEWAPVGNGEPTSVWAQDYYSSFAHPVDAAGHPVPWLSLPVVDKLWNDNRADKGGFIQQATGWKPSVFQAVMDVDVIERAVNMGDDDFRQAARERKTPAPVEYAA